MTYGDSEAVRVALQAAERRILELEAERNRWRDLLVEVVGFDVAARMYDAGPTQ